MDSPQSILFGETEPLLKYSELHRYFENLLETGIISKDKLALISETSFTFEQLNRNANQVARLLLEKIVLSTSENKTIAVLMKPCSQQIVSLFAILKLGMAYLPLDMAFPSSRIVYILEQAKPLCIIIDSSNQTPDSNINNNSIPMYCIHQLLHQSEKLSFNNLHVNEEILATNKETKLACVLYTSGSTGVPKGVKLPHRVVMNRLQWQWKTFPFDENDVGCFKTALTFVDSISEIFGNLLEGISIVIIPKNIVSNPELLVQILEEKQVTRIVLVPTLLRTLLVYFQISPTKPRLPKLKYFVCSGEIFPKDLLSKFFDYYPTGHIISNYYGSSEVMGDVTYMTFKNAEEANLETFENKVPIGKPIFNTTIYLFSNNMNLTPPGGVGEIYVSGLNVAAGYIDSKNEGFFKNALTNTQDHQTLYKTNDLGKIVNGILVFEGRTDSKIKIRGNTIDLTELENCVRFIHGVEDCVALIYKPNQLDQKLLVYYVTNNSTISKDQVLASLRQNVAPYMVPILLEIEEIPLLVNGKVDRVTLINKYENDIMQIYKKTVNEEISDTEKILLSVVSQIIKANVSNINASFFDIGGNSMNSIETVWLLFQKGLEIPIADFLNSKSLKEVALKLKPLLLLDNFKNPLLTIDQTKYRFIPFSEIEKEKGLKLLADSFFYKGVPEQFLLTEKLNWQDYYNFIEQFWEQFKNDGYSYGLLKDSELVGISTNFDVVEEPTEMILPPCIVPLMGLVLDVENPVKNLLPKEKGKYFYNFLVGAKTTLNTQESIEVVKLLETENVNFAKSKKFLGILTTNVNPLTQQVCVHLLDYHIEKVSPLNAYTDEEGRKPYENAPDHFVVMVVLKKF